MRPQAFSAILRNVTLIALQTGNNGRRKMEGGRYVDGQSPSLWSKIVVWIDATEGKPPGRRIKTTIQCQSRFCLIPALASTDLLP